MGHTHNEAGGQVDDVLVDEADAFVTLLLNSAQQQEQRIYVSLTMRTDFLGDCTHFIGLPEAINQSQFLTPLLNLEQLRDAIVGPARVYGGDVEPALVNRLVNDMGRNPDQLPLMQHVLMRMWMDKENQLKGTETNHYILTLDQYIAIGGIAMALSRHADEAYSGLNENRRIITEIMFRCLSEYHTGKHPVRRPLAIEKIASIAEVQPAEVKEIADVFRQPAYKFLTPIASERLYDSTVIDISHESLIRQWERLRQWAQDEANSANMYQRLMQNALLRKEGKAGLWGTPDLELALAWKAQVKPNAAWAMRYGGNYEVAMKFLEDSQKQMDVLTKRYKYIVAFIFFVIILIVYYYSKELSYENYSKELAYDNQILEITASSLKSKDTLLNSKDPRFENNFSLLAEQIRNFPEGKMTQEIKSILDLVVSEKTLAGLPYFRNSDIKNITISPDKKYYIVTNNDCIGLWSTKARDLQKTYYIEKQDNNTITIYPSPKNSYIAMIIDNKERRSVKFLELTTGKITNKSILDNTSTSSIAYSQDEKYLATTSIDNTIRLWDITTGKIIKEFPGHQDVISEFSPKGKYLVTAGLDNTIRLWDITAGKILREFSGHQDRITAITFSPDERYIATASADKTARLWDISAGKKAIVLSDHQDTYGIAFSQNGRYLATASNDQTASLWDTSTGKKFKTLFTQKFNSSISFDQTDNYLIIANSDTHGSNWWNIHTGKLQDDLTFLLSSNIPYHISVLTTNKNYLALASNKSVRVWDINTNKLITGFDVKDKVDKLLFSHGEQYLVAISADTIRMWDINKNIEYSQHDLKPLKQHNTDILAVSPDGKYLVASDINNTIKLLDISTGKESNSFTIPNDKALIKVLSPNGSYMAAVEYGKSATIWDMATHKAILQFTSAVVGVTHIAFSSDERLLAITGYEGVVHIIDIALGKEINEFTAQNENRAPITNIAFSLDGKYLATASIDKAIRVWDIAMRRQRGFGTTAKDTINDMAFSQDGKRLMAVLDNGGVFLYYPNFEDLRAEGLKVLKEVR